MKEQEPVFPLWEIGRLRMGTDGKGITCLVCAQGCPLDCRFCINPSGKRFGCGKNVTASELVDLVRPDSLYYIATGGGVTFGGGEPLLHADFISCFRVEAPAEWRINAETSLFIPEENLLCALPALDTIFVDIKDMNPEIYKKYTGSDNATVIRNLQLLAEHGSAGKTTVRVPLIPGFNSEEDRDKSVSLLKQMGFRSFDLFTYRVQSGRPVHQNNPT